jgi:hypothetical protein
MMKSIRDYMNETFSFLQPQPNADEKAFKELPWYIKDAREGIAKRAKNGPVTFNVTLKLPDERTERVFHEVVYKNGVEQTVREERHAGKNGKEEKLSEKHYVVVEGVMFEEQSLRKVLTSADEVRKEARPEAIVTERTRTFAQKLQRPEISNEERRVWIEGLAAEPGGVENASAEVGFRVSPIQAHARELLKQETISTSDIKELVARIELSKLGKESSDSEFARLHHTRQVMTEEIKRELANAKAQPQTTDVSPPLSGNVFPIRAGAKALPERATDLAAEAPPISSPPTSENPTPEGIQTSTTPSQPTPGPKPMEEKEGPEI